MMTNETPISAAELAALDEEFRRAEPLVGETHVPDGTYQVEVTRVYLARTRDGNEPMLRWEFTILGPTHAGARLFKNHLFRPQSMPYLKTDLQTMGVRIAGPSEIPDMLDTLVGRTLNVRKATRNERENIYVNSAVIRPGGAEREF